MPFRCENCFNELSSVDETCPQCGFTKGDGAVERIYLNPGTLLWGRYVIGRVIGAGGFGIIYKAWDNTTNMVVAVKEYFQSGLVSRVSQTGEIFLIGRDNRLNEFLEGKQRFIDEAVRIREFAGHPNMVAITDVFEQNNTVYQVMEFLQGDTLETYLSKHSLSIEEKVGVAMMVGEALKTLHHAGILHRDVSPDNIIIPFNNLEYGVKLFDFGAARFHPKEKDSLLTRVMKHGFSPPEQYGPSSGQNQQTDIYALGATLYYLLTGMKPEESTNRRIEDNVPTPKALNEEIPDNISNAVLTAMALDLQLRYKTIEEFSAALTAQEPVLSPKQEMKKRRKKRLIISLISAACIIVGFAIYGILLMLEVDRTTLPDGEINLLYTITGDQSVDRGKLQGLTEVVEEFLELYPNVRINIMGIELEDYSAQIDSHLRRGDYPAVFESTALDPSALGSALDVSSVITNDERNDCHFLSNYTRHFPERRQMPIGFNVSAVYINHQLSSLDGSGVSGISALLATMPSAVAGQGLSYNSLYQNELLTAFGSGFPLAGRDSFIDNETGAYFSSTSEYNAMLEDMPGRFALLYVDSETVPAEFGSLWSVMPGSGAEEKISVRFMQFMLHESAQHFLHIGSQSGSLPLNKESLQSYSEIFVDFREFFANIERYSIN